jgi:hypothetical protein
MVAGGSLCPRVPDVQLSGRICHSRTTHRADLRAVCAEGGREWYRELWWSSLHRVLGLGGIVVELRKL